MSRSSKTQTIQVCRLGDVLRRHNEIIHPGDRSHGNAIFVGLEHVEPNTGTRIGSATVEFSKMSGRKPTFRKGQVVYGYLRPYLNKVWIAEFDGCSSVDQFAFDVNSNVADTAFVAAFMRSETFLRRAARSTTPGQLPRISIDEVLAVELELPSLAEQRRMAGELTAAMEAVERARRAAQARLAAAEALPAAYLREVFEGPDVEKWSERTLGELLQRPIRTGISKRGRPDSEKMCLTLSSVRGRNLLLHACKGVDIEDKEADGSWVEPGCFYVVRGNGNRDLVGRGAFAPCSMQERILFPDLLFRVDLNVEENDPDFFWCLWSSAPVRQCIQSRARTAAGIYKINTANLNSLPLLLPDLRQQREIARRLLPLMESAEALAARCRDELAAIDALPAAYLRQAFEGLS